MVLAAPKGAISPVSFPDYPSRGLLTGLVVNNIRFFVFLNVLFDDILIDAYRTHVISRRPQVPPSPRLHLRKPIQDHQGTFPFEVTHKLGYTQLRRDFHVDLYVIHTDTAFHPFHTLVLTEPPQYFPYFLANPCEESLAAIFRDKYDRIAAIPTGVGQTNPRASCSLA